MTEPGSTAAAAKAFLHPLEAAETTQPVSTTATEGTGGELVIAQAKAAGVEYLFSNPGSFEVGLYDAVIDNPGVQLIVGLHEGLVISMADGYHKVSGKPGFIDIHAGNYRRPQRQRALERRREVTLGPRPGFDRKEVVRQVPYPFQSAADLLARGQETGLRIWQLVLANEASLRGEAEVRERIFHIWRVMQECTERGLNTTGRLPGGLNVVRRAPILYAKLKGHGWGDPLLFIDWLVVTSAHQRRRGTRTRGGPLLLALRLGRVR